MRSIAMTTGLAAAVMAAALAGCAQARPDPLPGYQAASPDERAAVMGVISAYYAIRNRAAVTGDIGPLYSAHPSLAHGEDRQAGVNAEAFFVQRMRAQQVSRVSVDLEEREPVKVYVKETAAVAYVHGRETWDLPPGMGQTMGEIFVRIDLRQGASGWLIERTDEAELGERVSPTPR
jgi:hypothetical protein